MKTLRINIDDYFMGIAEKVKERSTCKSRQVGCVLVKNNQILATGYNGSIKGHEHCNEFTCKKGCKETIHSEMNAVISAAYRGINISSCNVYTTTSPCINCLRVLLNLNIRNIFFKEKYKTQYEDKINELLKKHPYKVGVYQL